ncbi:MAG: NrdH-redoxin [Acidimicrobiia bacterium]|nr:NrdH-redoxin [Acidimicrobiia bacterium]
MSKEVTVYWRPGCGFCARLFLDIEDAGVAHNRVNIWEDQAGAEFVRSVANGSETVPTVVVGKKAMVNPSLQQIQADLSE